MKNLKAMVLNQRKPVEIPGFAILVPINHPEKDSSSFKPVTDLDYLISNGGIKNLKGQVTVKLIMHNDFLSKCGDNIHIPSAESTQLQNVIVLESSNQEGDETP